MRAESMIPKCILFFTEMVPKQKPLTGSQSIWNHKLFTEYIVYCSCAEFLYRIALHYSHLFQVFIQVSNRHNHAMDADIRSANRFHILNQLYNRFRLGLAYAEISDE